MRVHARDRGARRSARSGARGARGPAAPMARDARQGRSPDGGRGTLQARRRSGAVCVSDVWDRPQLLPLRPAVPRPELEGARGCRVRVTRHLRPPGADWLSVAVGFLYLIELVSPNASPPPRKSTTDRSIPWTLRALRLWFAVESRIAPSAAERRAARMFATP